MDIFHKSLKDLGAKRIFGFNSDDKTAAIWNVQFADKSACTFIYYFATKEWRIVDEYYYTILVCLEQDVKLLIYYFWY